MSLMAVISHRGILFKKLSLPPIIGLGTCVSHISFDLSEHDLRPSFQSIPLR